MLAASQSQFKFDRFDQSPTGSFQPKSGIAMRKSPGSYHRRSVSCLAVASYHEHYNHPSYYLANDRLYDTLEVSEGSASPVHQTRHAKRKSDGAISLELLQRGLSGAGIANANVTPAESKDKTETIMSGSLNGKLVKNLPSATVFDKSLHEVCVICHCTLSYCSSLDYTYQQSTSTSPGQHDWISPLTYGTIQYTSVRFSNHNRDYFTSSYFEKVNIISPANTPRRSLLSDLLNSQGSPSRLEQAASRRRMLKSMRRYSVDASEMDFSIGRPSTRVTPMKGMDEESPLLVDGRQGFSVTPMVRYLRNPCHAAVKTKLQPSAYRTLTRRGGNGGDDETPDYFGAEGRVW
ncbi:hypothetical protein EDD21DRAFT_445468 [Dissophora ornata]|nr:hypothetical protein EDD21DRAFT_445468 [Dissophora ornata]